MYLHTFNDNGRLSFDSVGVFVFRFDKETTSNPFDSIQLHFVLDVSCWTSCPVVPCWAFASYMPDRCSRFAGAIRINIATVLNGSFTTG